MLRCHGALVDRSCHIFSTVSCQFFFKTSRPRLTGHNFSGGVEMSISCRVFFRGRFLGPKRMTIFRNCVIFFERFTTCFLKPTALFRVCIGKIYHHPPGSSRECPWAQSVHYMFFIFMGLPWILAGTRSRSSGSSSSGGRWGGQLGGEGTVISQIQLFQYSYTSPSKALFRHGMGVRDVKYVRNVRNIRYTWGRGAGPSQANTRRSAIKKNTL